MRLAIGGGWRKDDFRNSSYISGAVQGGKRDTRYAYGELSLPVISADNARPGIRRLEFSAALRAEDYSSFGGVTTPKLGIIYAPTKDFTIKASWGRSFKAPTLAQTYGSRSTSLYSARSVGCASCAADATVLVTYGGNPDLKPERARTSSASLDFHPEALPGLKAELTYFNVDYTQRVVLPVTVISQAMSNSAYAQFVQSQPSSTEITDVLKQYSNAFYNYTGSSYDSSKVVAIVYNNYTNVAEQHADGVDFNASYQFSFAKGNLDLRGTVSWLHISQKNSSAAATTTLTGAIYQPAKFNGRVGAVWSKGGFSASAFGNYTPGVTSNLTAKTEKTSSFTTFDGTVRYEINSSAKILSGLAIALSVDNIFNRAPPLYTPSSGYYAPYDSTNYSAVGRYISLSISKHFF